MSLGFRLEFLASESISVQKIFNAVRLHEITEGERESIEERTPRMKYFNVQMSR